ncbi:MAG: hypothetical protein ABI082_00200 [Dokdonella sp.]
MVDAIDGVRDCYIATGPSYDTIEMMNNVHQPDREGAAPRVDAGNIHWRTRYDGLVTIAELGGKAVAGISGPWSGQYALTWWDRPLPTRSLELFDSLDAAKREVDGWARRMRTGNYSMPPAGIVQQANLAARAVPNIAPTGAAPIFAVNTDRSPISAQPSLLGWVRAFLPNLHPPKAIGAATNDIERLRLKQEEADIEFDADLHFSADK